MIVPDASALLVALTVDSPAGDAVRERLAEAVPLHAPHVVDLEVLSAIRGLALGGKLDTRRADQALADWRDTRITRHAHHPFEGRVWQLRHNLTVYDAAYVATAEALGCALLSGDADLDAAPGVRCEIIIIGSQ